MDSNKRREAGEEGEQEEVECLEGELRRKRRNVELLRKRKGVGEEGDGVEARPVGVFLRGASTELVSYSKPMPFDKVLEELCIIRDCKNGVIFKRGSTRSMAGEVVLTCGEYDFLPSSLTLYNARRLFCDSSSTSASIVHDSGTVVKLLSPEGVAVGMGVIESGVQPGMVLMERKLCPLEAAVRVTSVVDGTFWIGETYNEYLGSCMGLVIRWKKSLLRTTESGSTFGKPRRFIPS